MPQNNMSQEDHDAANAALILDERVDERIFEALERNPARLLEIIESTISSSPQAGCHLYRIIEPYLPAAVRHYKV